MQITTHEIYLSLGYFDYLWGQIGRKRANMEVKNQKSANIDIILNA